MSVVGIKIAGQCHQQYDELAAIRRSLVVAEFSVDGRTLDVNEKFGEAFGYDSTEVLGRHHSMLVAAAYAESSEYREFWVALSQGMCQSKLYQYIGKQGHEVWIEASYSPIIDDLGIIDKIVCIGTDVTKQKIIAAEQQGQIAAIRKSMAVGEFSLEGFLLDANDNYLNAFGYCLDEVKGFHHSIFVTPEFAASNEYALFWDGLREGRYQAAQYKRTGKNGKPVWIEASYNPILDLSGRPYKIVKFATDVTERKQREDARQAETAYAASHDVLTGLPNRAFMRDFLATQILSLRPNRQIATMLLDLDGFKAVNDTYGHSVGDAVLIEVSCRIAALVTSGGMVARWGGDEFALCLDFLQHGRSTVGRSAQALLNAITKPFRVDGHSISIGVSIGISVSDTNHGDVDDILRNADAALYYVKENGRKGYRVFDRDLFNEVLKRRLLEADLETAIREKHLMVIYQPVVDAKSGYTIGAEALCRWTHPLLGSIPPSMFIPLSERNGMIADLGFLIIDQVLADIDRWPESYIISINLSPKQLEAPNFLQGLKDRMKRLRVRPERVEFEVTETVLLDSDASSLQILRALKLDGFQIALDDFGTGYSSLSYLKLFPFDRIKIDRSFVSDIADNHQSAAIVTAVTHLAHALDMKVTAEGIETAEQFDLVSNAGCDAAQGYYIGKSIMPGTHAPVRMRA